MKMITKCCGKNLRKSGNTFFYKLSSKDKGQGQNGMSGIPNESSTYKSFQLVNE
jgi:hypothetical protein